MEIVVKTASQTRTRRNALLAAYLTVAVPVSGLLWQLLTPAPQTAPRPFLPMRDALAPKPPTDSSLTLPFEDEEAAAAETSAAAPARAATRPLAHGRATDPLEQLRAGLHAGHGPAGAGHGTQARGRLAALAGFLNSGGGSGAHSGAMLGGNLPSAPLFASAGPLGSVGLVRAGASKRFSPARLRRAGGVNGFMGSGRPGTSRLLDRAPLEPEFRAAASAGLPGYATPGQPNPGGMASVGGAIGMGEGHAQDDSDDSSSSPSLPLGELPEAGPAVDARGLSGRSVQGAACEAYTQAVTDSAALLESLRAEAKKSATALLTTTVRARTDAITWKGHESTLIDRLDAQLKATVCRDALGNDHCHAVRQCLWAARTNLFSMKTQLGRETDALYTAGTHLYRAPGAGEAGYASALDAVTIENGIGPMFQRYGQGLRACENAASQLPARVCGAVAPNGLCVKVDFAAGRRVQEQVRGLADLDRRTQEPLGAGLQKTWCDRYDCEPADLAQALRELGKHAEALQVWGELAPKEPVERTADAAEHLEKAAAQLKAPAGDDSRNLVKGALELEKAAAAMAEANGRWSELKEEACKPAR